MRAEDKEIGLSADVEQTRREDRAQVDETLLETGDDRASTDRTTEDGKTEHLERILQAVDAVFAGAIRPLDGLGHIPPDELTALQFLEAAVTGRHASMVQIVYAEDRRDLLEQALAVLYPTLSHAREEIAVAYRDQHDRLVGEITGLRDHLAQLDDAEGDVIEMRQYQDPGAAKQDDDDGEDADGEDAGDPATVAAQPAETGGDRGRAPGADAVGDPGVVP